MSEIESPNQALPDLIVPRPASRHRQTSSPTKKEPPTKKESPAEKESFAEPMTQGESVDSYQALPSVNPIISLASRIVSSAYYLKRPQPPAEILTVLNRFQAWLQSFQKEAEKAGYSHDEVVMAHYLLCAFIDDAALSTPWGVTSEWIQGGVTVRFASKSDWHQRNLPGQDFFEVLDQVEAISTRPGRTHSIDLLELCYLLLSLGFKGRYSLDRGGEDSLQQLRERLFSHLEQLRGDISPALSAPYHSVEMDPAKSRRLPIWVALSFSCCVLLLVYFALLVSLSRHSDPLVLRVDSLEVLEALSRQSAQINQTTTQQKAASQPNIILDEAVKSSLADYLATHLPDLTAQRAFVVDLREGRETIVLQGDDFFSSGGVEVNVAGRAVIAAIAKAIQPLNTRWEIRGHTDDIAMYSLQYPSNWYLAKARALAVQTLLIPVLGASSVSEVRSFGEYEPVVPNDSKANRAKNRRVELVRLE